MVQNQSILHLSNPSSSQSAKTYQQAGPRLQAAAAPHSSNPKPWTHHGYALLETGKKQEAIASFNKALHLAPDCGFAWHGKGLAFAKLFQYEDALECFQAALSLNPKDGQVWYNQGTALNRLQRYRDAIQSFDRAIAIKPHDHRAWFNRAKALGALKLYRSTLESLHQAIEVKPDCYYALNYQGLVLAKLRQYKRAIASFERSIEVVAQNPSAWFGKARVYALQGDINLAVRNLSHTFKLSPHLYRVIVQTDEDFQPLHQHPSFQRLLRQD